MPPVLPVLAVAAFAVSTGFKIMEMQEQKKKARQAEEATLQAAAVKKRAIDVENRRRKLALDIKNRELKGFNLAKFGSSGLLNSSIARGLVGSLGSSTFREKNFADKTSGLEAEGVTLATDAQVNSIHSTQKLQQSNTIGSIVSSGLTLASGLDFWWRLS